MPRTSPVAAARRLLARGIELVLLAVLTMLAPAARATSVLRKLRGRKPAILHAPYPIIATKLLAQAERQYGYRSETLVYQVYDINAAQDFDHVLDLSSRGMFSGLFRRYTALAWALFRFDVFTLFFHGGLLANRPRTWRCELPLLKLAGKKIVVYPYGSDARLPSKTRRLGRWNAYTDIAPGAEDTDERRVQRNLDWFGRFADVVLGCADLVEDLPRVDGIFRYPIDIRDWRPTPPKDDSVVRIVHAPNHRHYKGTRFFVEAVATLAGEGLPVELVLIERTPLEEARRMYAEADIVADQLLIGAYAQFAIEGMALRKPVVCYLNERFRRWHPEWDECPIVNANPDDVVDRLRELVTDGKRRAALGRRGLDYVRKYHSLESVGRDMDEVYTRLWHRTRKNAPVDRGAAASRLEGAVLEQRPGRT